MLCRIFQFENFARTKKRVLSQEDEAAALVSGSSGTRSLVISVLGVLSMYMCIEDQRVFCLCILLVRIFWPRGTNALHVNVKPPFG